MRQSGLWLALVALLLAPTFSEAQMNRKAIKKNNRHIASFRGKKQGFGKDKIYNAIGFSLSALNYYGDLSPLPQRVSTDITFTRPAFSFSFAHRFGPRYTLQAQFMWGTLRGSDQSAHANDENGKYRYQRNLSFRNQIKELSVVAYFDLFENMSTYISRVKWTPYVYLGVAGFLHNPQAKAPNTFLDGTPDPQAGKWVNLHDLGTEGQYSTLSPTDVNYGIKPYSLAQVAIPFGAGVRFRLNEVVDLWGDIGFRYTFTDYLDDVSQNFVDLSKLKSPLAQALSYRSNELFNGNPPNGVPSSLPGVNVLPGYGAEYKDNIRGDKSSRDIYMVTNVRITYILGATFHKAKFR